MTAIVALLLRCTLFLAAGLICLLILRNGSSASRHWVASLLLIGLLVYPMVYPTVPKWEIPIEKSQEVKESHSFEELFQYLGKLKKEKVEVRESEINHTIPPSVTSSQAERRTSSQKEKHHSLPLHTLLLVGYLLGVAFFLIRYGISYFQVRRMVKKSYPFENKQLYNLVNTLPISQKLKEKTQILKSTDCPTPMVIGVFHPVILLPVYENWTNKDLEIILLHEWGHIHRQDYLLHVLAQISFILYWFHPLVWWVRKIQLKEREKACDEFVINKGVSRTEYAEKLLSISQQLSPVVQLTAISMAKYHDMKKRIISILSINPSHKSFSMKNKFGLGLGTMFTLLTLVVLQPVLALESFESPLELSKAFLNKIDRKPPLVKDIREIIPSSLSMDNSTANFVGSEKKLMFGETDNNPQPTLRPINNSGFVLSAPLPYPEGIMLNPVEIINDRVPSRERSNLKRLKKVLKKQFPFIPGGNAIIQGEKVAVESFYISKEEIDNINYLLFLEDLRKQKRNDDLAIARVRDENWLSLGKEMYEAQQYYHTHPHQMVFPVVNVSYQAAKLYCQWLTDQYKITYPNSFPKDAYFRLPTQAEWLRAARGNSIVNFPWVKFDGLLNTHGCALANTKDHESIEGMYYEREMGLFLSEENSGVPNDNFLLTAPTTAYFLNENGVYNVLGNVSEMLHDVPDQA
ncbi:MAG: M56 family metallopeptidase, partial [Bacteroidota bacterium]